MQIKRMMVPTELDRPSDISLKFALDLAHHLKVKEVILLHPIVSSHTQTSDDSLHDISTSGHLLSELKKNLMKKRKKIVEKKASDYSDNMVTIIPDVKFTESISGMNKLMQEYNADLLVCQGDEKISLLEILFGSVTEKMIRKIDYPMIVIKGEPVSADIQTIALAVDLEEDDQSGIEKVIGFADLLQAQLQLVYVRKDDDSKANEDIEDMQKLAKTKQIQNYAINVVKSQSLEDGLEGFVQKVQPDMIAVITQGKGKLHKLIYGSNTEEVIKAIKVPVFVCKSTFVTNGLTFP